MEVIPYTLAENAGLNPISTVTELRNRLDPYAEWTYDMTLLFQACSRRKNSWDQRAKGRNHQHPGGKRCAAAPCVHQLHHPRLGDCEKYPQDRRYSQRHARLKVTARQYWICHFFEPCHNMILNLVYNLVLSTVELTAS